MLTRGFPLPARRYIEVKHQAGVVLIIALIVLVAMTLAAIGLVRSVDTNNMIAGNLAFQQSATHSADVAIEEAITWLEGASATTLQSDDNTWGYSASGSNPLQSPVSGQTWSDFWNNTLVARGVHQATSTQFTLSGNTAFFVIDRMCNAAGSSTGGGACVSSPIVTAATGNAEEGGAAQINAPSIVYYRITVRVNGPKNTVSYIQAMVAR